MTILTAQRWLDSLLGSEMCQMGISTKQMAIQTTMVYVKKF